MNEGERKCPRCGGEPHLTPGKIRRRIYTCKACASAATNRWRAANKAQIREYDSRWRAANPERIAAHSVARRKRQPAPPSETGEWRAIAGYPDYEVSSLGYVRRHTYRHDYGANHRPEPLLLRQDLDKHGRPQVNLARPDGTRRKFVVAHLVAAAFIGPRPAGTEVCHNDGIAANNRAANLRYDTPEGNLLDKLFHAEFGHGRVRPALLP